MPPARLPLTLVPCLRSTLAPARPVKYKFGTRRHYGIDLTATKDYTKPRTRDAVACVLFIAAAMYAMQYDRAHLLVFDDSRELAMTRSTSAQEPVRTSINAFTGSASSVPASGPRLSLVTDPPGKATTAESAPASDTVIDIETSLPFPRTLQPLSVSSPLELVGLGVRKVSFLKVKVYCVGLYASPEALRSLGRLPGWRDYTKSRLLATKPSEDGRPYGEQLMRALFEQPFDFALRIGAPGGVFSSSVVRLRRTVPTRPTDGSHLRDGFARAIQARTDAAVKRGDLLKPDTAPISEALVEFKDNFIKGSVPKGKDLILVRRGADNALVLEYDGAILGAVKNDFVGRELLLAYFSDSNAISPSIKESVAAGFERILTPPV